MNEFTLNMLKNKLEKISDELKNKGIPYEIVHPEEEVLFSIMSIPISETATVDTQLYYIPLDNDEPFETFLLQIVSSFNITDKEISTSQLQVVCDAVNLRSPIGTLFIDPEDKCLYCRHSLAEDKHGLILEQFNITFDLYCMTLSMAYDLINKLLK